MQRAADAVRIKLLRPIVCLFRCGGIFIAVVRTHLQYGYIHSSRRHRWYLTFFFCVTSDFFFFLQLRHGSFGRHPVLHECSASRLGGIPGKKTNSAFFFSPVGDNRDSNEPVVIAGDLIQYFTPCFIP